MEWEIHVIQDGLTLSELLTGDIFFWVNQTWTREQRMRTQRSSLESESRRGPHAREPNIGDILFVRMILILSMSEIDEGVINCRVDNDIEFFLCLGSLRVGSVLNWKFFGSLLCFGSVKVGSVLNWRFFGSLVQT